MTKAKVRKPSKRWIGKVLVATEDAMVPVLSGSSIPVAEVRSGQRLKVVDVQTDGWLLCRYLDDVYFQDEDRNKIHCKALAVGVHFIHDVPKFSVRRFSSLRQEGLESPVDVVKSARSWIAAKQEINSLKTTLAQLSGRSQDLESKLLTVVRELDEQVRRIDSIVVALQKRVASSLDEWYTSASGLLAEVSKVQTSKARGFREETQEYAEWLQLEQAKLVQAYSWLSSFSRRVWGWLRKTEGKITEMEQLVFYSD